MWATGKAQHVLKQSLCWDLVIGFLYPQNLTTENAFCSKVELTDA
jgi:hypothetical protein